MAKTTLFIELVDLENDVEIAAKAFERKKKEVFNLVYPHCLEAMKYYNKNAEGWRIYNVEPQVNASSLSVTLDVRLIDAKGTHEPDEELSNEDETITKELAKILNPIFDKARIPLKLAKIRVPPHYFGK